MRVSCSIASSDDAEEDKTESFKTPLEKEIAENRPFPHLSAKKQTSALVAAPRRPRLANAGRKNLFNLSISFPINRITDLSNNELILTNIRLPAGRQV